MQPVVQGSGFRVQGSGIRSWFRVQGSGLVQPAAGEAAAGQVWRAYNVSRFARHQEGNVCATLVLQR
jgi:hypothetical protein